MKVCFPVQEFAGMASQVHNHFGSSPSFVVVDTQERLIKTIANQDRNHAHGGCNPFLALGGEKIEILVVGGIGGGALNKVLAMGVKVYAAGAATIQENLRLLRDQKLEEIDPNGACRAHHGECGHHAEEHDPKLIKEF
jgi:predicted Fe-Mo cluster-binding NifX family protein